MDGAFSLNIGRCGGGFVINVYMHYGPNCGGMSLHKY